MGECRAGWAARGSPRPEAKAKGIVATPDQGVNALAGRRLAVSSAGEMAGFLPHPYDLGSPSPRVAITLRFTSLVPAAIVLATLLR